MYEDNHTPSKKKGFFDGMPSQTAFTFGVVTGIAAFLILGYIFPSFGQFGGAASEVARNDRPAAAAQPSPSAQPSPAVAAGDPAEVTKDDHVRGDKKAKVSIIEYSDFECPFCSRFHPTMVQALEEYGDDINWVYRHFPLSFHVQATPSALASECVAEQKGDDGFWTFADAMFENQARLGTALYSEIAESIGVDMGQYNDCFDSQKYLSKVQDNQTDGASAGVTGTPGSFIVTKNGAQLISGAVPYSQIKAAIEANL